MSELADSNGRATMATFSLDLYITPADYETGRVTSRHCGFRSLDEAKAGMRIGVEHMRAYHAAVANDPENTRLVALISGRGMIELPPP